MAKKKPCEYCEGDIIQTDDISRGLMASMEIYPDNGQIAFGITGCDNETGKEIEFFYTVPMDYCPACGRKLT